MAEITLASLNTLGITFNPLSLLERYKAMVKYFDASGVDVIHFQEVLSYLHLVILRRSLKKYPYCCCKTSYLGPKGGLVMFSRYPLDDVKYLNFSKKYIPLGLSKIEPIVQKGVLTARLQNTNIKLLNTHLSVVLDHDWTKSGKYFREMESEINEVQQVLKQGVGGHQITIATGDFNIARGSDLFGHLIDLPGLFDPFKSDLAPTRHPVFGTRGHKTNCVDYLFIFGDTEPYKVKNSQRIFSDRVPMGIGRVDYVSDHVGLEVTLKTNSIKL